MTTADTSAYAAARIIRQYRDALQNGDPLAYEISLDNLPLHAAANTFERRRNGVPRCELYYASRPCIHDADLLTAKRGHTNSIRMACHHHLKDFLATATAASWTAVLPLVASPSHQRWAAELQQTHRLMRQPANQRHQQDLERADKLLRRLLIPHNRFDFICTLACCAPYRDDAPQSPGITDLRHQTLPAEHRPNSP